MCNLRVIQGSEMVTSTSTPPQRLGYHKSMPQTPSQSPRGKYGQFNKSPSPTGFAKGKQGKGFKGYPANPTPKKSSVSRSHSSPMAVPPRGSSSPLQGRGSPHRYGSPQPSSSFAGSKCYEPPTPSSLPKPPTDWFSSDLGGFQLPAPGSAYDISAQLKLLLKVEA